MPTYKIRLKCKKCGEKYDLGGMCYSCGHKPIGSIVFGVIAAIIFVAVIANRYIE